MSTLVLVPFGAFGGEMIAALEDSLAETFHVNVRRTTPCEIPVGSFDATRNQYNSEHFLRTLYEIRPSAPARMLGLTEVDLFIPMLSFVFGQAQLNGRVAVVSVARMRQEFYELPADPLLARERIVKEAVHEVGHVFGLTHCLDKRCPMSLSTTVTAIDAKEHELCGSCRIALQVFRTTSQFSGERS